MAKVLIVDDEETIRFSFGSILADAGYDVFKASCPVSAKSILSSNKIDVAIVDRMLESYNGMDLVHYIHKVHQFCTTIIISAFPTFKSASEGFRHRVFAYLQKPVKKHELCEIVETASDVSMEKRQAFKNDQQLFQSQKMTSFGLLSSGIVHDFNNLLMCINGYADLSIMDIETHSPLSDNLNQIQKAIQQGEKLTKLLLTYFQQHDGKFELVCIQSLMKEALSLLRTLIPKSIIIKDNINGNRTKVLACPTQIEQVIMNLGINAAHSMDNKQGIIEVSLNPVSLDTETMKNLKTDHNNCIQITIKDNGCGMDNETLEQIFEPFFSTRHNNIGTGIGLSTSRRIIKNHGGAIKAESQHGKGSSFHVYIPITNSFEQETL